MNPARHTINRRASVQISCASTHDQPPCLGTNLVCPGARSTRNYACLLSPSTASAWVSQPPCLDRHKSRVPRHTINRRASAQISCASAHDQPPRLGTVPVCLATPPAVHHTRVPSPLQWTSDSAAGPVRGSAHPMFSRGWVAYRWRFIRGRQLRMVTTDPKTQRSTENLPSLGAYSGLFRVTRWSGVPAPLYPVVE